ncbi:MAG TPA: SatD family protein [Bacillota bacterium]|jgi:hypothetical protein|nr:SatD family protein [Bacillota bacterium]
MIPMGEFVAIKMDMRGSRRIGDRERAQEQFLQVMESLNREFAPSIQARFIVTHGDEAQGMLKREFSPNVLAVMERAMEGVYPVELRFGIGIGTLSTPLQPDAIGMDGQAWHAASRALDLARSRRKHVMFSGFGEQTDEQLCALANLLLHLRNGWSPEQRRAIELVDAGMMQSAAAEALGVSESAISQRLAAAGWHFYKDGRDAVISLLRPQR